jgi:hypothetical protein
MARYRKVRNNNGIMGWARMVPFTYVLTLSPAALANGGSISGTVNIDPGLPFILCEMGCAIDADTSTLTTASLWNFSILDGEAQQQFSNGPVPRERMFGTRDFPRQLPSEVDLSPSDQLTVTATNNTGGAVTSNIRICFTGYKLVSFTQSQPE